MDAWTRKANYPGKTAYGATAFSSSYGTGDKGYLAGGVDNAGDFVANTWGSEPNIPYTAPIVGLNGARYAAFGFGIGNIIYIGGGESTQGEPASARADFWALPLPN